MGLRIITPPEDEPVDLDDVKTSLGETGTDSDTLIGMAVASGRQSIEQVLGRVLMPQTWELVLDEFPCSEIRIPLQPVQSIVSIKYDDADGLEQTVSPDDYVFDETNIYPWVVPLSTGWPATLSAVNAVRVRFLAGYPSAADVPAPLRMAVILMATQFYSMRGASSTSVTGGTGIKRKSVLNGLIDVTYMTPSESSTTTSTTSIPMAVNSLISTYRVFA